MWMFSLTRSAPIAVIVVLILTTYQRPAHADAASKGSNFLRSGLYNGATVFTPGNSASSGNVREGVMERRLVKKEEYTTADDDDEAKCKTKCRKVHGRKNNNQCLTVCIKKIGCKLKCQKKRGKHQKNRPSKLCVQVRRITKWLQRRVRITLIENIAYVIMGIIITAFCPLIFLLSTCPSGLHDKRPRHTKETFEASGKNFEAHQKTKAEEKAAANAPTQEV